MKTPLLTLAGVVFAVSTAFAQGGSPGVAPGGATPSATPGSGSSTATPGAPGGQSQANRDVPPGARLDPTNTPGWAAMSADERSEHMTRMQSFGNYKDCQSYMSQHGDRMRSRSGAPNAGVATSRSPGNSGETAASALGGDACGHLPRS